jgi:anti-sigma factor RsiW
MRGGIMGWLPLRRFVKDECAQTKGMLSAYIDQRLSLKELRGVEHHLEACQRCREELDSLRATVGLLHRVPQVSPSRSFAIAEVKPVPRRTAVWALRAATSIAAVFLVVLFAGDLFNLFEATPSLIKGAPSNTQGTGGGEEQETAPSPEEKWYLGPEVGLFGPAMMNSLMAGGLDLYAISGEEGPSEEEEPSQPSEEEVAREEAGWLHPLEYGFLGVVVVLGGATMAAWQKEKKSKKLA